MTEYRGYWLPTSFDNHGAIDEYWACREGAVVMDLSPLRKFEVVGPDAEALLQAAVTRNIRKLATGQVVYTAICNETGGMLDDATMFRLGPDTFRFVGGDEYDGTWLRQLAGRLGLDQVWIKHSTDQLHNIAVQGPKSRDLLRELVWTPPTQPDFGDLTWFRFAIGRIGGPEGLPLIVSRTGYSGELGYELWCHPKRRARALGRGLGGGRAARATPLGLDALDILRIEAGLIFAGYEFCDQVDPFEAGIGFTVPLKSKEDDFVGRAALERRKASPQRALVGLELDGNEPAAHGDCVHVGRSPGRRHHQRHPVAAAAHQHRAVPDGGGVLGDRHRGRRRQAGRPAQAHSRDRRPVPVLRPGQDPPAFLTDGGRGRPGRCAGQGHPVPPGRTVPKRLRWKMSGSPA